MPQKAPTRYTPPDEAPHINAEDDAQIYRAVFGGSGITDGDLQLACSIVNNNTVRLSAGTFSNQGYMIMVPGGFTQNFTVDSGTGTTFRRDLLVAEFIRGGGNNADKHEFKIIKGLPASTDAGAVAPTLLQNNLAANGSIRQEPLYELFIRGTTLASVKMVARYASAYSSLVDNTVVSAKTLPPGSSATVEMQRVGKQVRVVIGVPQGASGDGSGDMVRAVYDKNNNGIVDNAEKFGDQLPNYYLDAANIAKTINLGSGRGQIASNDDMNDYVKPGSFVCLSGAITNSLKNCPVTGYGFMMFVSQLYGTESYGRQRILMYNGRELRRGWSGSGSSRVFTDWGEYVIGPLTELGFVLDTRTINGKRLNADVVLRAADIGIQTGTFSTASIPPGTIITQEITFPKPYASSPAVNGIYRGSTNRNIAVTVQERTTDGAVFTMRNNDTASYVATVDWIAVGAL